MDALFSQIPPKSTIVTPNRRLATQLKRAYYVSHGERKGESLDILPWNAWLKRCYEALLLKLPSPPRLLNEKQSICLWRSLLEKNNNTQFQHFLNLPRITKQLQEAWSLVQEGCIHWRKEPDFFLTEDHRAWYEFANALERKCEKNHWITPEALGSWILNHLSFLFTDASTIAWHGFLEWTPLQEKIKEALHELGVSQKIISMEKEDPSIKINAFQNLQEELKAMAAWAKACYEAHPTAKIFCVLPNLTQIRKEVSVIFQKTFYPNTLFTKASERQAYNISGGIPLLELPLISSAFSFLSFTIKPWTPSLLGEAFKSPYIGNAEENLLLRSQVEFELYELGMPVLSPERVESILKDREPFLWNIFLEMKKHSFEGEHYPREWVEKCLNYLNIFQWPGSKNLDSDEYQQMAQFYPLLQELSTLDEVTGRVSWLHFFNTLTEFAEDKLFQVETHHEGVQVLGLLEAAGHPCDFLWIGNLHDNQFPTPPHPNPWLPLSLQKRKALPHCSPERELKYCEALFETLRQQTKGLHLSYPQREGDQVLSPSVFLKMSLHKKIPASSFTPWIPRAPLDLIEDVKGPPLTKKKELKGGTGLIRSQSACGFQAFARYRCHAISMNEISFGLTPLDRGILLHEVLQRFWGFVKNHDVFMEQSDWSHRISVLVNQTVSSYEENHGSRLTPLFLAAEKKRLQWLVEQWLHVERERPPFKIHALEAPMELQLEGLSLRGRIDRIDELNNGEIILIDYKTGATHLRDWFGETLQEPQLPLYALCQKKPLAGIVFAEVNHQSLRMNGVTKDPDVLPSVKALAQLNVSEKENSWEEQLSQWKETLSLLAKAFCEGDALIDPKHSKACEQCDLPSLCRFHMEEVR